MKLFSNQLLVQLVGSLLFISLAFAALLPNESEAEGNTIEAPDFSFNGRPAAQIADLSVAKKPLLCYYGSWAVYRLGNGKFDVENLEPAVGICTHIIYSFVGLGPDNRVRILDSWNDIDKNAFRRTVGLKKRNPNLKVMLAIGGWNEGSRKYSLMTETKENRKIFIESVVDILTKFGFDGFDLDWEYPTVAERGGRPGDRENFASLIKEMRVEFDKRGWYLSAAVSAGKNVIDIAYDVKTMSDNLDSINIMAYDYHGSWDRSANHHAALFAPENASEQEAMANVQFTVEYWLSKGASPSKLVLGMPTYGRSFALSSSETGIGAPASGPGPAGVYTREAGMVGYNEICLLHKESGWKVVHDPKMLVPYTFKDRQWIGYDDPQSITAKSRYVNKMNLGGAMIWSIETDDFQNECGTGAFPIIKAIRSALDSGSTDVNVPKIPTPKPSSNPSPVPAPNPEPSPNPQPAPNTDFKCTKAGLFRNPKDCSTYFQCTLIGYRLQLYTQSCPSGTVFDEKAQICNWANLVPECNQ